MQAKVVADRLILDAEEVFLWAARPAGVAERLEVLLGATGDARFAERVADERGAATGRGADDVGTLWLHC